MSIPTGGLAASLVVATLALSSCGSDGASVTTTTTVSPASVTQTATQTVAAETKPATTTEQKQTTAPKRAQTTTQATAPAPKPAASKPESACPPVDIGVRDGDIAETYARVTSLSNTSCQLAALVIQQWGGELIGRDKALLPLRWSCSKRTCSEGSSSVTFVIEPPANSD